MSHELPRELMESCLAAAEDATFDGFDTSVIKEVFNDPQRRRIFHVVYRMGFESGWRIREQQIAAGASLVDGQTEPLSGTASPLVSEPAVHAPLPPTDEQIIERCKLAGIGWVEPDGEPDGFPGMFDMATMGEMRALLADRRQRAVEQPDTQNHRADQTEPFVVRTVQAATSGGTR